MAKPLHLVPLLGWAVKTHSHSSAPALILGCQVSETASLRACVCVSAATATPQAAGIKRVGGKPGNDSATQTSRELEELSHFLWNAQLLAMAQAARLLVMTVFFGPLPPWLPLTLYSMEANHGVDFVVVGDAKPPSVLPKNVRFENIAYDEMQRRIGQLTGKRVKYLNTYKANDIKPLLPALYPSAFEGYEWWGWADLDVVFGNLLKFLALAEPHPACCRGLELNCNKRARRDRSSPCFNSSRPMVAADTFFDRRACPCMNGEQVTAVSPLYPNPWRKKCWGPFTLFKASMGLRLFERAVKWKDALSTWEYTHFDEWWGPFTQRGYDSMGDVMTKLSDRGELVMSRTLLPFSEAKSCVDIECTFCPCGATHMRLDGHKLVVNGEETMILHLAESKQGWFRAESALGGGGGRSQLETALPQYHRGQRGAACFEVSHLGAYSEGDLLQNVGPRASAALQYARHRPSSAKAAAALVYYKQNGSAGERMAPQLVIQPCAGGGKGLGVVGDGIRAADHTDSTDTGIAIDANAGVRRALRELVARYDAFTAGERLRTLDWLCAWQKLSDLYAELVTGVDLSSDLSRRLPEVHGNRRVRTPMYGGERLGWWRQTVNTSVVAPEGACHAADVPCVSRRWPEDSARGKRSSSARHAGRRHGRRLWAEDAKWQQQTKPRTNSRAEIRYGRTLKAKRVSRYDLNTPPIPGVACLPLPSESQSLSLAEAQERIFSGYLQLQHVRRAEYGRTQRWMCSWLYKLRACVDAERAQRVPQASAHGRCRNIKPPDHTEAGLGWRGYRVSEMEDVAPLLFQLRCW